MGQEITIKGRGGNFMGYLAKPASGPGPGVVCIQEIFGVNSWMRAIADDIAKAGHVTLVPDLFWRIEPGLQINGEDQASFAKAFELYGKCDVDKGVADIQDAINHLRNKEGCPKVGDMGFCLGSFLAYLCSARTDADANVGYYGIGIETKLEEASRMRGPLLLHIASADQFVPLEAQKKVHAGLDKNAKVTIHDYTGEDHAFARKGGHAYRKAAADLAEKRTLAFFKKHIG
ncbi:MAG: dienelactone hydrolase family protein [Alphaproteobacteria bacterium]|nr:dienelactone hydrolase family protein [Alphaproteobacteria bacterium]